MTYEEAKTMLEKHQAWARSESKRYSEAVDVAIECIEKQIPKKPNTREQGSTTVTRGFCTECLRTVFSFDSYCPTCGQAIDWSDEE